MCELKGAVFPTVFFIYIYIIYHQRDHQRSLQNPTTCCTLLCPAEKDLVPENQDRRYFIKQIIPITSSINLQYNSSSNRQDRLLVMTIWWTCGVIAVTSCGLTVHLHVTYSPYSSSNSMKQRMRLGIQNVGSASAFP